MKAVVADSGQVTIPEALRERLGITAKTILDFQEENGALVVRIVTEADPVSDVYGCVQTGRTTDDIMAELRGEA